MQGDAQKEAPSPRRSSDEEGAPLDETTVVPLAEEHLTVRTVSRPAGRVVIQKQVREWTETVDERLTHEAVDVRRVPVGRVVEAPPPIRDEGETTIIPVLEERLVVRTELVLKEELHVTRRRTTESHTRDVTLRREEADVRREAP